MHTARTDAHANGSYALLRRGLIILLLLSPLLPYAVTMIQNSYRMASIPAKIKALPVYPNAKIEKEFIQQDAENGQCLTVTVQYRSPAPQKNVDAFYETLLLKSGWYSVDGPTPASHRYTKSSMTITITDHTPKTYRIYATFGISSLFQPGCQP